MTIEPGILKEAADLVVFDKTGKAVKFGTLFAERKTVVVFTRHFFCGIYVQLLSEVPQEALKQAETDIVIIGCGQWEAIGHYEEQTGLVGKIYAEPTRKLYHTLRMDIETLAGAPASDKHRSYVPVGALKNALRSTWEGPLKNPSLIGKQGHISQLGGDFVFGPGNQCTFAHIMQHTEDHVEVAELMKQAGVTY